MKKRLYLLALLLISVLTIGIVKAEEGPYVLDWETNSNDYVYFNFPYKDGYLFIDQASTHETIFKYYNKNGELVESARAPINLISINVIDDNVYLLLKHYSSSTTGDDPEISYSICTLDDELEISDSLELEDYDYDFDFAFSYFINKNIINKVNNHIYVFERDFIYEIDEDLESYELLAPNVNNAKIYFPALYAELMESDGIMAFSSAYNNKYVVGLNSFNQTCLEPIPDTPEYSPVPNSNIALEKVNGIPSDLLSCYNSVVFLLDDDYDGLWFKEFEGTLVLSVELLDDYVLASIYNEEGANIIVYDYEGNEVQRIPLESDNNVFLNLKRVDSGFAVSNVCLEGIFNDVIKAENKSPTPSNSPSVCSRTHQLYVIGNKINTKVEGKGKVTVQGVAKPGEPVTFTVEPEDGYVLSSVKVTDANGNVLEFHDYTFTMPSADVEVEVLFVQATKNPETRDIALLSLMGLLGIAGVGAAIITRKKNRLRSII